MKWNLTWKEYGLWAVVLGLFVIVGSGCVTRQEAKRYGDLRYIDGKMEQNAKCAERLDASYDNGKRMGRMLVIDEFVTDLEGANKKSLKDIHREVRELIDKWKMELWPEKVP